VIAVGDVHLEIALRITLRGTVKELAAFMETLNSSSVVVGIGGAMRAEEEGSEKAKELCARFGVGMGKRG
jgi:hypothetical protein